MIGYFIGLVIVSAIYLASAWYMRRKFVRNMAAMSQAGSEVAAEWMGHSRLWEQRAMALHEAMKQLMPHVHSRCAECYVPIGGGPDEKSFVMNNPEGRGVTLYCIPCSEKLPSLEEKAAARGETTDYWQGPT